MSIDLFKHTQTGDIATELDAAIFNFESKLKRPQIKMVRCVKQARNISL